MLEITECVSHIIGNPMIDPTVLHSHLHYRFVFSTYIHTSGYRICSHIQESRWSPGLEVEENHRGYLDSQKEELKKPGPLY